MSSTGKRELYVYYRVDPSRAEAAIDAVRDWQRTLVSSHAGLAARVLAKDCRPGEAPTLMEIYASPWGVSTAVQADIEQAAAALGDHLVSARHVEVFIA